MNDGKFPDGQGGGASFVFVIKDAEAVFVSRDSDFSGSDSLLPQPLELRKKSETITDNNFSTAVRLGEWCDVSGIIPGCLVSQIEAASP